MRRLRHATWFLAGALLAAWLLPSCVSEPEQDEFPTLAGSFVDEGKPDPLIADQAYVGNDEFFVRFWRGGKVFYGGGRWSDRINLLSPTDQQRGSTPFILPLEKYGPEPWASLPEVRHDIRMIAVDEWEDFKGVLFDALLSPFDNSGMLLHFNVDDYFVYYDENKKIQARVIEEKPADYLIAARVAFPDLVERGMPLLDTWLKARGIDERRIAFNTGDTGNYSLPFLYVNRDLPLAIFVRQQPVAASYIEGSGATPLMQTVGHVAGSHTTGLIFRPLSSVYRLFFVVTDTVAETAKPDYLLAMQSQPVPPIAAGPAMNLEDWEAELDEMTGREATNGTLEYLIDGESFFTRFIDAVVSAQESISLRTYIFDNDDYAARIGGLLKRRSNEGIDVKVLLDGLGTIISTIEKQPTLPEGFSGPASVHQFLEHDSNVKVRQAANPWMTGDHVKTAVIDEKLAFTGGMNIAREYRYDWHDLMVELQGPVVGVLHHEFEKAWVHSGVFGDFGYLFKNIRSPPVGDADFGFPIRVLFTRADRSEIFEAQLEAIRRAQKYVYVENAYFTDDVMLYELAKARRRGVDVRVIMPLVTDRGPITRNNALAANALLEHGIRIFVYPGMSHVKAAIFDGWACLGSANWDRWSFKINRELNIATSHPDAVDRLHKLLFAEDFARSVEMTEPFPERWSDYLLEMIGDYIF